MIKAGDKVRIKPEWRGPDDYDGLYVAIEDEFQNGAVNRVGIEPLDCKLAFKPWHTVDVDWIEKAEK